MIGGPEHYDQFEHQPCDIAWERWGPGTPNSWLGINLYPALKYILRAGYKDGASIADDLRKARDFIDDALERIEE